jgi:hypothetical protein
MPSRGSGARPATHSLIDLVLVELLQQSMLDPSQRAYEVEGHCDLPAAASCRAGGCLLRRVQQRPVVVQPLVSRHPAGATGDAALSSRNVERRAQPRGTAEREAGGRRDSPTLSFNSVHLKTHRPARACYAVHDRGATHQSTTGPLPGVPCFRTRARFGLTSWPCAWELLFTASEAARACSSASLFEGLEEEEGPAPSSSESAAALRFGAMLGAVRGARVAAALVSGRAATSCRTSGWLNAERRQLCGMSHHGQVCVWLSHGDTTGHRRNTTCWPIQQGYHLSPIFHLSFSPVPVIALHVPSQANSVALARIEAFAGFLATPRGAQRPLCDLLDRHVPADLARASGVATALPFANNQPQGSVGMGSGLGKQRQRVFEAQRLRHGVQNVNGSKQPMVEDPRLLEPLLQPMVQASAPPPSAESKFSTPCHKRCSKLASIFVMLNTIACMDLS